MTPAQCRLARKLVGLSREEVAKALGVPAFKLLAFEVGGVMLNGANRQWLRRALELAGVEFVKDGVRLRK